MLTAPITMIESATSGRKLDPAAQAELIDGFLRDGVAVLPGLLAAEAPALRERTEAIFADPALMATHGISGGLAFARGFELDRAFRDLLVAEPMISIAEAILGPDCHMTSQNILRTPPGKERGWHVDDGGYFLLPDGVPRHQVTLPTVILHMFVLLSDVPSDDYGPTQIVPGSQHSGRLPAPDRIFEGRGPVSVLGRAGDVYLHHNQTWHCGALNRSDRTRYLIGTAYGRRWVSQRLFPFVDYQLPASVVEGADDRLLRVLGRHPHGSYA
jgi:hypothetical protein